MTRAGLLFVLGALVACNPMLSPDPPVVHQPEGACAAAERHLRDLGCGKEADTGGGFGAFCERTAARSVDLHPQCVSRVTNCSQFNPASRGEGC
jgi:hypothetical protein